MGAAFVYMYFVGLGTSLGVLTTVFIGYKGYKRIDNKKARKKAVGGF